MDRSEDGSKVLVVGKRFAVSKEKHDAHETKEEQQESFSKLQGKMQKVDAVDQDRTCMDKNRTVTNMYKEKYMFPDIFTYLNDLQHAGAII